MLWRWPFPDDMPGDGSVPVWDVVASFTVVDVAGCPVAGRGAVLGPRRALARPKPRDAVRTDEVFAGLRVIGDRVGGVVVVRAIGEVDLANADVLAAALRAGWATGPRGMLVVDLTGIGFFSAAGLALLVTTEQQCRERQIELRVVAPTRSVLRPLQGTGLDVLFDITPTLVAAIGRR
jgi:anti-sigma B factor antagonist